MSLGPKITADIIKLITAIYFEHTEWRAKEIQREVNTRLRKARPNVKPDWPGLSAVQKELTKIRKRQRESPPDPADSPWHVGSLTEYELPPEALPTVLKVWLERELHNSRQELKCKPSPLTIRQAKWVARLYRVISDIRLLDICAMQYALDEQIHKISGLLDKIARNPHDAFLFHNLNVIDDSALYRHMTGEFVDFDIIGRDHPEYDTKTAMVRELNPEFVVEIKRVLKRPSKGGTK